jgi:hypothetical protein
MEDTPVIVHLSEVGLALVSGLILRIVYLVSQIELVLAKPRSSDGYCAAALGGGSSVEQRAALKPRADGGEASSTLPHCRGVMQANDALPPLAVAPDPPARQTVLAAAAGASEQSKARQPLPIHRASTERDTPAPLGITMPDEPAVPSCASPVRRNITISAGQAASGQVPGVISPLRRRSSRGAVLSHLNSPAKHHAQDGGAAHAERIAAELEALDVLPLTTPEEAPLLMRM